MRSLVIYVSHSGNTKRIAEAIAGGLGSRGAVDVVGWADADAAWAHRPDLVVVGGPTERHAVTGEIRSLFEALASSSLGGAAAAAFDTRLQRPTWLSGSAAKGIDTRLRRVGARLIAPPESFFVTGKPELAAGEVERAAAWAATLADRVDQVAASPAAAGRGFPIATLPPLSLPWDLKPVSSATSGSETLPDGRTKYWVKHNVLKGVTPAMLVWWFGHLEGDVEIEGQLLPRYRVWHPLDHVSARYVRRAADGSIGPGAQMALSEVLGGDPRFTIATVSTIEKLDEEGLIHKVVSRGITLARMEHTFREVAGGTIDENSLTVPGSHRIAFLSRVLVPRRFPEAQGRAWLRHSIEEMGTLEKFLPDLYARETTSTRAGLPAHAS